MTDISHQPTCAAEKPTSFSAHHATTIARQLALPAGSVTVVLVQFGSGPTADRPHTRTYRQRRAVSPRIHRLDKEALAGHTYLADADDADDEDHICRGEN